LKHKINAVATKGQRGAKIARNLLTNKQVRYSNKLYSNRETEMKSFSFILSFSLLVGSLFCYIPVDYEFSWNETDFTEITEGIVLGAAGHFYDVFADGSNPQNGSSSTGTGFPIGFDFRFNGSWFDRIGVSCEGWISFGQSALTPSVYLGSTSGQPLGTMYFPVYDILISRAVALGGPIRGRGNSEMRLQTIGTAPDRICVIQWKHFRRIYDSTDDFTFQVRLYETSNVVQFRYGAFMVSQEYQNGLQAGVRGPHDDDYQCRKTAVYGTWQNTLAGSSRYDVCSVSQQCYPPAGLCFNYTPITDYENDLLALNVTGYALPFAGSEYNYTVRIWNRGTSPQDEYLVKLYSGTEELASAAGLPVISGQSVFVQVPWTSQVTGEITIYAKVVLYNDENNANDDSDSLTINMQPGDMTPVTIGSGDQLARIPIDFYWMRSLYETIFYSTEMDSTGYIHGLTLYPEDYSYYSIDTIQIKIWLGNSTVTDLEHGWVPSGNLTMVYDGDLWVPVEYDSVYIPFSVPFGYWGNNLVMLLLHTQTHYGTFNQKFYCQTVGTDRARNWFSDGYYNDPAYPAYPGTLGGQFPKTTFWMYPGPVTGIGNDNLVPVANVKVSNFPNPFSHSTSIRFITKTPGNADVTIYDVKGRAVVSLIRSGCLTGENTISWDGKDSDGKAAPSGIYYYRLAVKGFSQTGRMVLLK
jgi:hypothetical protein